MVLRGREAVFFYAQNFNFFKNPRVTDTPDSVGEFQKGRESVLQFFVTLPDGGGEKLQARAVDKVGTCRTETGWDSN